MNTLKLSRGWHLVENCSRNSCRFSSSFISKPVAHTKDYLEIIHAPEIEQLMKTGVLPLSIYPDFLSPEEESLLVKATDRKLRRLCRDGYREAHFDSVIHGYKEAMVSAWQTEKDDPGAYAILDRMKRTLEHDLSLDKSVSWTPPHVLDLRDTNSGIKAHVDFVQASGSIIAGLCLVSPAVMVFRHKDHPKENGFKALLPARCMYVQRDMVRYTYTHEIPVSTDKEHSFRGDHVDRKRRISIMIRDKLKVKPGSDVEPTNYKFQSYG